MVAKDTLYQVKRGRNGAEEATGAWRLADLRPRPPKVVGTVAFSHAHSDRGLPAMSLRASLIIVSNLAVAW